jgi:hypothetical protein
MPALSKIIQALFAQRKEFINVISKQKQYIQQLEKELKELKELKKVNNLE